MNPHNSNTRNNDIDQLRADLAIALERLEQQEVIIKRNQEILLNILNKVTGMSDDVANTNSMVEIIRCRC